MMVTICIKKGEKSVKRNYESIKFLIDRLVGPWINDFRLQWPYSGLTGSVRYDYRDQQAPAGLNTLYCLDLFARPRCETSTRNSALYDSVCDPG